MINSQKVLAQNEAEYMNADQLAFFSDRLQKNAQELLERIHATLEGCVIERHPQEGDFAFAEEQQAMIVNMIERDKRTLSNIRLALEAIALGDYGFCRETGEPIGLPRLMLIPESLYSVESMRVQETKRLHLRRVD